MLLFNLREEEIVLATDTLACDIDGSPSFFVSKATILPHLGMVIVGTGIYQLLEEWVRFVSTCPQVANMADAAEAAQEALPDIAAHDIYRSESTTIYHFGFRTERGVYGADVFRSTSRWQHEEVSFGFGSKPNHGVAYARPESFPDGWAALAEQMQKEHAPGAPAVVPVHIGGELVAIAMQDSTTITAFKIHRFASYSAEARAIAKRP